MRETIGIVTSCRNYGRYLSEWADSIIKMTRHPDVVAIVDDASTDQTPRYVSEAMQKLTAAGISVRAQRIEERNFGKARNAAVRLAGDVTWVQHLDCDDMAMSHMLDDWEELAPYADVVPMGYERCGDLPSGPANRTKVYKSSRGQSTLDSTAPASGVSPFRRSLWEQRPYVENINGGWDTALWIGFGHLNARFVATRRPCFLYRQHADSIFNRRRKHERHAAFVGRRLNSLRRGDAGVSVIVPWQSSGGDRDKVWAWLRRRWQAEHPDYEIVQGVSRTSGAWCKGEAVWDGVEKCKGAIIIVADADCWVPPQAIRDGVDAVENGAPWVIPHRMVKRMDETSTASLLQLDPADALVTGELHRDAYEGFAGGGMFILRRSDYEASGGIPTRFRGGVRKTRRWR